RLPRAAGRPGDTVGPHPGRPPARLTGAAGGTRDGPITFGEGRTVLSSYPVACPYEGCGWTGNLIPSRSPRGANAEAAPGTAVWSHCPRCQRDGEAGLRGDGVVALPATRPGG